ncbi:MAG: CPBP family intramembrane metalloprotease [Clostridia bacterium]|nr:CPBP family intramembrane metalloprotease [Clostridia bacterium]
MKFISKLTEPDAIALRREARSLWFRAVWIGVALVVVALNMSQWYRVYYFIMAKCGFTMQEAYLKIASAQSQQILQIVISSVSFILPFSVLLLADRRPAKEIVPFRRPKGQIGAIFWMGMGFCAFADVAVEGMQQFFRQFHVNYQVSHHDEPAGFIGFLLMLFATAITPAVVEEFACRGVMYGLLEPFGQGFAVMTSSILFGIMHGNFEQIPFAFLVGLGLGFARAKTGSMWVPMAIHCCNNLLSVVLTQLRKLCPAIVPSMVMWAFLFGCLTMALVSVLRLQNEKVSFYEFHSSTSLMESGEKAIVFFCSPAILLFIIYSFMQSLRYFV